MKNADDVLTFLAVARAESISAAARLLGNDPATVGRKVQRLEDTLRATLFAKSPRGYHLTEAGLRLLERAEEMETVLLEIDGAFSQSGRQLQGRVRIGAPDGCATFLLPQICAQLSKDHPGLVLEVVASSREFELDRSYFLTTRRDDNRFKRMETLVERIHTDICDALATR